MKGCMFESLIREENGTSQTSGNDPKICNVISHDDELVCPAGLPLVLARSQKLRNKPKAQKEANIQKLGQHLEMRQDKNLETGQKLRNGLTHGKSLAWVEVIIAQR